MLEDRGCQEFVGFGYKWHWRVSIHNCGKETSIRDCVSKRERERVLLLDRLKSEGLYVQTFVDDGLMLVQSKYLGCGLN